MELKMNVTQIIGLLSGIAMFLFGMKLMGDGLKSVAGNRLEVILYRLSSTTPRGVLLGTGVTAVIQSSCATSVMAVGFVNSGMMKIRQAVSVILGSIIGTSITGWIICLNYIDGGSGVGELLSSAIITGVVAVIGIILCTFVKRQTANRVGYILMGFAILMFGMSTMSASVSSLGENGVFHGVITSLSNPALGVLVGILLSTVLQSASAAVGIIQALSVAGTITVGMSLPLLMGIAIGAGVPVLLSAIGATANGKRAALIYPVASIISVVFCAAVFYIADAIVGFEFTSNSADPFIIASVNTILRLIMVIVMLPFADLLEKLVSLMVKEKAGTDEDVPVLEEIFIAHPALAVEQSRAAINEMADKASEALRIALGLIYDYNSERYGQVAKLEESVDRYEDSLGTYLVKLTGRELTERQNKDVSTFLHTLSDFERISDHALNIAESAKEMHDKGFAFSESATNELKVMTGAVGEIVKIMTDAFLNSDVEGAKTVEPLEELIDELCDKIKLHHVERLQKGECTINQGFVLNDLITNFERVSDHCSNVAVAMIELESDEFDTHKYLDRVKHKRTPEFERQFEEYKTKFDF